MICFGVFVIVLSGLTFSVIWHPHLLADGMIVIYLLFDKNEIRFSFQQVNCLPKDRQCNRRLNHHPNSPVNSQFGQSGGDTLTCAPMLVIAAGSTVSFLWGGSFSSLHRSMHQSFPKTPSIAGAGSGRRSRHEIVPTYRLDGTT